MVATVPVPIEFRLPEGWYPAPPGELGAPGIAFVALHPHPDQGFTANITLDEAAVLDGSLDALADASVDALRAGGVEVTVADRRTVGSAESPGLTQTLALRTEINGLTRQLAQAQVYLTARDTRSPDHRALIRSVLTATAAQFSLVLPDFQHLVWTVRPDRREPGTAAPDNGLS